MELRGFKKYSSKLYSAYLSMQIVYPFFIWTLNILNILNVSKYDIQVCRCMIFACLLYEVPCFGCEFILFILEYDSHNFYSNCGSLYLKANETQQQGPSKILWIFGYSWHFLLSECCQTCWQCFMAISGVLDFKTTVRC